MCWLACALVKPLLARCTLHSFTVCAKLQPIAGLSSLQTRQQTQTSHALAPQKSLLFHFFTTPRHNLKQQPHRSAAARMFLCTTAPKAPHFPADLDKLGFKLVDGKFVNTEGTAFFEYFHTNNEQSNDARKEAMHECARKVVMEHLDQFGIKELYLTAKEQDGYSTTKPDGPHVTILTTEVSQLAQKKDVVLVVGEAAAGGQDAGILAYRLLMREGGLENGTAVGLASRIAAYGQSLRTDGLEDDYDKITVAASQLAVNGKKPDLDTTPGLIMLNPGQLLYSYKENKPMSQPTWFGRSRKNALSEEYPVHQKYNRVPGNESSFKHIRNFFDNILQQLVREDVRLYVVCIGDSAKDTLDYMDLIYVNNSITGLADQIEAVALIDPNNDPTKLVSAPLKSFLAVRGRSWVNSPVIQYGKLVQVPVVNNRETEYSYSAVVDSDFDVSKENKAVEAAEEVTKGMAEIEIVGEEDSAPNGEPVSVGEEFVDVEDEEYEAHAKEEVSCPTFSAGDCDAITEVIFPRVMDDVLEFFWQKKSEAESLKRVYH